MDERKTDQIYSQEEIILNVITNKHNNAFLCNKQAQFDLDKQLSTCNETTLKIVNEIYRLSGINGVPRISQNRIARIVGIRRETVNIKTTWLHKNNIIRKNYNHRHPNNYFLNPFIFDFKIRQKYQTVIPALRWVSPILLQSVPLIELGFNYLSQCEYLTPLNNRNLFKNINHLPTEDQSIYFRERLRNVKNNKVSKTTTNRKQGVLVHDKLNKKEMVMLKKIADELELSNYEIKELGFFNDEILKRAYSVLQSASDIKYKFKYLMKVCQDFQDKGVKEVKNVPKVEDKKVVKKGLVLDSKPKYEGKFADVYTAAQIANELVKIDKINVSAVPCGEKIRATSLYKWADKDYTPVGDEYEELALKVIDKYRKRVGLPPRISAEFKPQSNLTEENESQQANTLNENNRCSNVKFEAECINMQSYDADPTFEEDLDFGG